MYTCTNGLSVSILTLSKLTYAKFNTQYCFFFTHNNIIPRVIHCAAILTIRQGRRSPSSDPSTAMIVGIATVELGGRSTSQPTYYFDCITNSNNGSGIRWTRMSTQHRFQVMDIPDGSPGKRMDATGINYVDLDVYTCSDQYSNQVTSVNITACELLCYRYSA